MRTWASVILGVMTPQSNNAINSFASGQLRSQLVNLPFSSKIFSLDDFRDDFAGWRGMILLFVVLMMIDRNELKWILLAKLHATSRSFDLQSNLKVALTSMRIARALSWPMRIEVDATLRLH